MAKRMWLWRTVVLVAIIAMARKVLVIDITELEPLVIIAFAFTFLVLGCLLDLAKMKRLRMAIIARSVERFEFASALERCCRKMRFFAWRCGLPTATDALIVGITSRKVNYNLDAGRPIIFHGSVP